MKKNRFDDGILWVSTLRKNLFIIKKYVPNNTIWGKEIILNKQKLIIFSSFLLFVV